MKQQTLQISASIASIAMVIGGIVTPGARAQSIQANTQVTTIPQGTMVRVILQRAVDSTSMEVGDKVRVAVAPDDPSGLPKDCVLVGRVTEVAPASKTAPGVVDVYFGALERAGRPWTSISVDLTVGNQPPVDQTANMSVKGQSTQAPNTKIIGYGAGAGAVLGSLFKHDGRSLIRGGLLGAAAGAVVADRTRKTTGTPDYRDVKIPAGTELTVTLNQPITVESTIVVTSPPTQNTADPNTDPNWSKLVGVMLQPTELQGVAVPSPPGTRKLYLQMTRDGKVQGFAGINTFSATYKVGGTYKFAGTDTVGIAYPLTFTPFMSTRMGGPAATMTLENKFLSTLATTTGYRPDGQGIALLSGNKVIARFKKMSGN